MAKRLKYDDVKTYINSFNYELMDSEYKNATKHLNMVCDKGHKCSITFDRFKQGRRCKICDNRRKTNEQVKLSVKEVSEQLSTHGYKLSDDSYFGINKKINIICPNNHCYSTTLSNFNRHKCQECRQEASLTNARNKFEEYNYTLLSEEYKSNKTLMLAKCDEGHEFKISFDNFLHGNRCPHCQKPSKGEVKICEWLIEYGIEFEQQKSFEDLVYKKKLRFDFYVPQLNLLIEYDGIQHFQSVAHFGGQKNLEYVQLKDNMKEKYCSDNNINLIRISYKEYKKIDSILKNIFLE